MKPPVDHQIQGRQIRQTVRLVKGFWYRAGVPRNIRRARADELRLHLEAAVADGRRVSDVVGLDLAAFAAEWASADVRRPWIEPVVSAVAVALLLPSLGTLLHVALVRPDEWGVPASQLTYTAAIVLIVFAIQTARWFRTRLTRGNLAALIGVTGVGYVALIATSLRLQDDDGFLAISPPTVALLLTAAVAMHAIVYWLKRTHRL